MLRPEVPVNWIAILTWWTSQPHPGVGPAWEPPTGTTWQWQLSGVLDTSVNVDMYDVDLFDTSTLTIDQLHADGRTVICYFSAGSRENWRPDANLFPAAAIGNNLAGWQGERWLDVRDPDVRLIMEARIELAFHKGCDGVEPDNVDGYQNNTGFNLSAADQVDFNRFLATEAHDRGLSVGLKNALGLVSTLQPDFDWALNEECLTYNECNRLQPFVNAGKAVFHTEYVNTRAQGPARAQQVCGDPRIAGFSTLIKTWDLDEWVIACP
ncbi:MAG: endo alpha-1,4 polygalactosaminidase [Alphaproteobacteria bacterium]|nr:endo alpha-1,4 polygalactosaminidase [Alphaproteobacteria bacterium]MCB9698843.1 endo alpha-1,4 polygalactosaminidase [Alphaproteobacteria bacterium]